MRPSSASTKMEIASFVTTTEESLSPGNSRKDIGTGAAQPPDSPHGNGPTLRESLRLPRWPSDR